MNRNDCFPSIITSMYYSFAPTCPAVIRNFGIMLALGTAGMSAEGDPVAWPIGLSDSWSTAVGSIKPPAQVLKIIDSMKEGLFADADDAEVWQQRVLAMIGNGLMADRNARLFFAPGIGLPVDQMSPEQFAEAARLLKQLNGLPGEKILCYIADDNDQWELWTSESLYAFNYGGGLSRVQKTDYGWNFPHMMFDGEKAHVEALRFWDLALSNDTMEDIAESRDVQVFADLVKLVLKRDIAPAATTTVYATDPKHTDRVLQIQNECRQALTARLVRALQKDHPMLTSHAGFRCARWGTSYDETSRLLMPFLLHQDTGAFSCSRPTLDTAAFYGAHPAIAATVGRTVKADLWHAVLNLQVQQITDKIAERVGIAVSTGHFGGNPGHYDEFVKTTGIPVAPDFDYWSYCNSIGRYTAWFIDDQFYAMEIEPNTEVASQIEAVITDLTARYGEFTDLPGERGGSRYLHEDADGGTLVMCEPSGGKKALKRIYHYSIKMRPMVNAKLASLQAATDKQDEQEKTSAAKKASQF